MLSNIIRQQTKTLVQCHHVADMNINSQRINNNCDQTTLHYKRCIFACLLKSNLLESNQIYYNIHDLKLRRVKIHDHYTTISNGEALLTSYPAQSSSWKLPTYILVHAQGFVLVRLTCAKTRSIIICVACCLCRDTSGHLYYAHFQILMSKLRQSRCFTPNRIL